MLVSRWFFLVATLALVIASHLDAHAQTTRPAVVALSEANCSPSTVDGDALASALRVALTSTLGLEPTIANDTSGADFSVALDCATPNSLLLTVSRTLPPASQSQRLAVGKLDPAARPAAVALAVAELVRAVMRVPSAPRAAPATASEAAPTTAPAVAPPPAAEAGDHQHRLRLTRNLAISFGALTVAFVVVGAPLLAIGNENASTRILPMVVAGGVALGLAGASLVTGAVSFGLWLRERRRPPGP